MQQIPKLPHIQRFNEEVDTLSMISKRNKEKILNEEMNGLKNGGAYGNLLSKTKSNQNIMMSSVLKS